MKSPLAATSGLSDEALFSRLKTYLIGLTGLAYYDDKPEALFERIERRMDELQCPGPGAYLALITSARGASELDRLIDEIAIGETYFFRYPEQFDALRQTILPERIEARRDLGSLRIWSAGCASGAEPYSIAILLEREWPEIARTWPISIEGTDICARRLERARHALYSQWEIRGLPDEIRNGCFRRSNGKWQLDDRYVGRVTFEQKNLNAAPPEGEAVRDGKYDIILCRNVLIYFDRELMRRVLQRLHGLLADGGWLLVGHAEPFLEIGHYLTPVSLPGTMAYRRLDATASPELPPVRTEAWMPSAAGGGMDTATDCVKERPQPPSDIVSEQDPLQRPLGMRAPLAAAAVTPPEIDDAEPVVDDPLARARRYANAAEWQRAREVCADYLRKRPLDADAHFLLALVHEHCADPVAAVAEFRQAVYLDRRFALAHFHLGRLHSLQGQRRQALRSYSNAIDVLSAAQNPAQVRGGEGLSSDELRALARDQMARLAQ